jgi:hypothetical protein
MLECYKVQSRLQPSSTAVAARAAGRQDTQLMAQATSTGRPLAGSRQHFAELVYELLDAHADTADMVCHEGLSREWQLHLAYLRDLQRVGREALAAVPPRGVGA